MPDWLMPSLLLAAGAAATYASRGLGVLLSGRIDPASPLFAWVGLVTYGLLASLVARMILLPIGPLTETSLAARLVAVVVGTSLFYIARKNLLVGVAGGTVALVLLAG
jgi:branched-subunit amino acid transport protein